MLTGCFISQTNSIKDCEKYLTHGFLLGARANLASRDF